MLFIHIARAKPGEEDNSKTKTRPKAKRRKQQKQCMFTKQNKQDFGFRASQLLLPMNHSVGKNDDYYPVLQPRGRDRNRPPRVAGDPRGSGDEMRRIPSPAPPHLPPGA